MNLHVQLLAISFKRGFTQFQQKQVVVISPSVFFRPLRVAVDHRVDVVFTSNGDHTVTAGPSIRCPVFTARHNTVNSFSSLHVHPEFLGSKVDRRLNCCPSRLSSCLRERPHLHARVHLAVCVQVQAEGSAREETIGEAEWKGQWLKGRTSAR